MNPIEKARQTAREIIAEAHPNATETDLPQDEMYEFDAVYTNDEECGIESVSIMHDPDKNVFALALNPYPLREAENEPRGPQGSQEPQEQSGDAPVPDGINWKELAEEHELAYFFGDLATSSPESYTTDELREISDRMDVITKKVEAAMKAEFDTMPPEAQAIMLNMLCESGSKTPEWWIELLVGEMPDDPDDIPGIGDE